MREIATIGATGLLLAFGFATCAAAGGGMGGEGGPSDRWGTPYALIDPQHFPSGWTDYERAQMNRATTRPRPVAPTHTGQ